MKTFPSTGFGAALALLLAPSALAQPSFLRLGDLAGGSFVSQASAVSSDGSVVAGFSRSGAADEIEAFR